MTATVLSALELAAGTVLDRGPRRGAAPLAPARESAAAALERAVLPALRRPPCLVSFSGGRDSSLVLAAAVRVARRERLAPPIAATNRFDDAPATDESCWQERVVAQLGLTDWLRLPFTDELDLVGPYAQRLLRAHGLLWPANVHFHLPLLDAARGGSLLTGIGGDELFGAASRPRAAAVLARDGRPRPRDLALLALAHAPAAVRRPLARRRLAPAPPWLRPAAARAVRRDLAAQLAAEPFGLRARMASWREMRHLRVALASLSAAAADADVLLEHPLLARELWSAAALAAPRHGFAGRASALGVLFGGWLPAELVARRDKAHFDEPLWNEHSRALAEGFDGGGVPHELVDWVALREHWLGPRPVAQSASLLQAAWLSLVRTDGACRRVY